MVYLHTKNFNFAVFLNALECKVWVYFMAIWVFLRLFGAFGIYFPALRQIKYGNSNVHIPITLTYNGKGQLHPDSGHMRVQQL
jgi:hypothetical protein